MSDMRSIAAGRDVAIIWNSEVKSYEQARQLYYAISNMLDDPLTNIAPSREEFFYMEGTPRIRITKRNDGNVYLRDMGDYMAVLLYNTEIVRYYKDGMFSVDNDGHNTQTTSTRVNQFTPTDMTFYHYNKELCVGSWHGLNGFVACNHSVRIPVSSSMRSKYTRP